MQGLPRRPRRARRHELAMREGMPLSSLFVTCRVYSRHRPSCCIFSVLSSMLDGKHSDQLGRRLMRRGRLFSDVSTCVSNDISTNLFRVTKGPSTKIDLRLTRTTIHSRLSHLRRRLISKRRLRGIGGGFRSARVFNGVGCLGITAGLT